ncbi:MAG: hypothetical protein Q4C65_06825 [Eubacteriales bacterium]|nr:hypothetical protein [Eubacteriales bacterium]
MADARIQYRLDLIVRLVDTTTGEPVPERQTIFLEEGRVVSLLERGTGVYILLNHGRQDTRFTVKAAGFETESFPVRYGELDSRFPTITLYLMPVMKQTGYVDVLCLEGRLDGLTMLEAADLNRPEAIIQGYQARRQTLHLMESRRLEEETYAMVHPGTGRWEPFRIKKQPDKLKLQLVSPLEEACEAQEPVARIVRGKVYPDGRYLLRTRAQGGRADYMIRYEVKGEVRFMQIDFYGTEERRLE